MKKVKIFFAIFVLVLFMMSGCSSENDVDKGLACSSDTDCAGFCGDDACLSPACSQVGETKNTCVCLGVCGVVEP